MPLAISPLRLMSVMLGLVLVTTAGCQLQSAARAPIFEEADSGTEDAQDAGASTTPAAIGDGCQSDSDCESGNCRTDLPDGYCTQPCSRSNPCPDGSDCLQTASHGTQCIATCNVSSDCRDAYFCQQGFCVPKCTSDDQCGSGRRCDPNSGQCVTASGCRTDADCPQNQTCNRQTRQCVTPTTMGGGAVGAACTENSDCSEGGSSALCLPAQYGFPQGYCTATCSGSSPCPNNNACVTFQTGQGPVGLCVDVCSADSECRSGYLCEVLANGRYACLPTCGSDSDCDEGLVCNTSNGRCGPPTTTTPDAGMGTVDAGTPITSTDGGYAGTITKTSLGTINGGRPSSVGVDIPADAVSSFFIATPAAGQSTTGYYIGLGWLTDPNQTTLYSVYSANNYPFRAYPNENGADGVLFPNAPPPGLDYIQGHYTAQFYSDGASVNLDITHLLKTATGPLTGGKIDVNLWFDNSMITAAQAKTGTNFNAMLTSIKSIWASQGIEIGNINFYDLSDPTRAYHNIQDGELGSVCRSTSSATNDGVNWVFIDSISGGGGGGTILGEAAGIPGTPIRGTGASCVVVSMSDWQGSSTVSMFATTIVHETGHWLGLFHTTEADGKEFDPLSDTLQCPVGTYDRNGDRQVDDLECSTRDGKNVMFWLSDSTGRNPHTTFTSNQQFVMLRNPAVY